MRPSVILAAAGALAASLAAGQGPPPTPQPRLSFGKEAVGVAGLSPGAEIVLFGATQSVAEDGIAEIRLYASIVKDVDRDGSEELAIEGGVPLHATWVAIDLSTGASTAAAPPGYPLRRVGWRGRGIHRGANGHDDIEDARPTGALLVARPGADGGAWLLEAGDNGDGDADRASNGHIRWDLSEMIPLGSTTAPPPEKLKAKDVVAVLDSRSLELTLVTRDSD